MIARRQAGHVMSYLPGDFVSYMEPIAKIVAAMLQLLKSAVAEYAERSTPGSEDASDEY